MKVVVVTYHLEMTSPDALRPSRLSCPEMRVEQARIPCPEYSRFLYTAVGGQWHWTDRLVWSCAQWEAHVCRPEVETWVGYVQGTPAGYFELERQPQANVEIAYFGLLPPFLGKGLGGRLLTSAVERAWWKEAQRDRSAPVPCQRVWVHTCSLDHPNALANYLARGFQIFKTETTEIERPGVETP